MSDITLALKMPQCVHPYIYVLKSSRSVLQRYQIFCFSENCKNLAESLCFGPNAVMLVCNPKK